jgi:hypothetical protein
VSCIAHSAQEEAVDWGARVLTRKREERKRCVYFERGKVLFDVKPRGVVKFTIPKNFTFFTLSNLGGIRIGSEDPYPIARR